MLTQIIALFQNISDNELHSYNLNGYKYLIIKATFPNAGSSVIEIYIPSLSKFSRNVTLYNGYFSNSQYYAALLLSVSVTSIQLLTSNHGTGLTYEPYYDVLAIK